MPKRSSKAINVSLVFLLGTLLFCIQIAIPVRALLKLSTAPAPIVKDAARLALHAPWFVLEGFGYLMLGIVVHTLLAALPIILISDISRYHGWSWMRTTMWKSLTTILFFTLVFLWNQALFPNSEVSFSIQQPSVWPLAILTTSFLALLVFWVLSKPNRHAILPIIGTLTLLYLPIWISPVKLQPKQPDQANIFLIGLDSVRPDHLVDETSQASLMPTLKRWMNKSIVFENAVTPMARTFPALTSLMTAKYPANNGARANLTPATQVDLTWTMGKHLQSMGYTSIFVTDDARFANFDQRYGFDSVVSPQQGLADFVFGDLLDTAGTNLLNLFPISLWLNPAEFGNRAAAGSYHPAQFNYRLSRSLSRLSTSSIFFHVHFCLAHFPYVNPSVFFPSANNSAFSSYGPYERGLRALDIQFANFLNQIASKGMLENAILLVYSDHGEELGIKKDLDFRREHRLPAGIRGHGTSVLAPSQNKILLSVQIFKDGEPKLESGVSQTPALLTDVAPTLLSQLANSAKLPKGLDGLNLFEPFSSRRIRFVESSPIIPKLEHGKVDHNRLLSRFGAGFFITNSLFIRAKTGLSDSQQKQRGSILGKRVVVLERKGSDSDPKDVAGNHWRCLSR